MSEFAPSDREKREVKLISGAAPDTLFELSDEHASEDIGERAVKAASELIAAVPHKTEEELHLEVESRYDAAAELVDKRRDQGVDETIAWREVDPTGAIQRDFRTEEQRRQSELNHRHAEEIRQTRHDAELEKIEQIADPQERARARIEFLARERVRNERRGQRA